MLRYLLLALVIAAPFAASGQERGRNDAGDAAVKAHAVEVADDRFTGKRAVRMRPVEVAPGLEMSLTAEVDLGRRPGYLEQDVGVMVTADFTTPYRGGVRFDHDMEFAFLVDGERTALRTSGARLIINTRADRENGRREAVAVLTQSTLGRVAAGRRAEMKLGETEVVLNEAALKAIRSFVKALSR